MKVGFGFDAHQIADLPPLKLGGVIVDDEIGLAGTSDADVLIHAVADAMLGAAALGDLGTFFPSDDERWLGADSLHLLEQVVGIVASEGLQVGNVDVTVIAQSVRVGPHREEMRQNLATALGVALEDVSVKATTTDLLGFLGRDEGIAATAVVLLVDSG